MLDLVYCYPDYRSMISVYRSIRGFILGRGLEGSVAAIGYRRKHLVVVVLSDSLDIESQDYLYTLLQSSDGVPYDYLPPEIFYHLSDTKTKVAIKGQRSIEEQFVPGLWVCLRPQNS